MSQNEGTGQGGQTRNPGGRPGAMTVAMQAVSIKPGGPKVLRIGVIQGGKIVEERIIRKRETVTVGSSERNHFVINASGVSGRFELFQLVGSDYILNFTEAMTGRVGLPAGVQTLEQLRSSGAARHAGSHWQVKLNDTARGKVVLGDVTLLFQFVVAPPVQPRPQLPAAARGGFAKSIDWMFTSFVLFSFMTHFGLVVYLENADWPVQDGLAAIPKSVIGLVIPTEPPPEELPPEVVEKGPESDETPQPQAETKPTKQPEKEPSGAAGSRNDNKPASGGGSDSAVSAQTAALVANAAASAEAMLVGALASEGGGALANVLAGGAVLNNSEDVLATAAGIGVAQQGGGGIRPRPGSGTGSGTGTLGALGAAGTGTGAGGVSDGSPVGERVVGRVTAEDVDDVGGSGDFDSKVVTKQVKQRLGAIKACYERQLRANPGLSGKVVIDFTIEVSGTVSKAAATANTTNNPDVASCIVGVFRGMRWNPGPEGGSVSYSYPFVFAPMT
jgi:hypothetical protein